MVEHRARSKRVAKARPKKAPDQLKPDYDWLLERTGLTKAWWVASTQAAVAASGKPNPGNKDHDLADPAKFLHQVAENVIAALPSQGAYDPNMRAAAVLGYVLTLWYTRLHLAKIRDPMRPLNIRREVYRSWLENVAAMQAIAIDEREDSTYFPGQEFEPPFQPKARSGKFV